MTDVTTKSKTDPRSEDLDPSQVTDATHRAALEVKEGLKPYVRSDDDGGATVLIACPGEGCDVSTVALDGHTATLDCEEHGTREVTVHVLNFNQHQRDVNATATMGADRDRLLNTEEYQERVAAEEKAEEKAEAKAAKASTSSSASTARST